MSQDNVEVVRSVFAAVNRGDRETAIGFLHPEVVIDATRSVFNPTTYVGMQGIRRWMSDTDEVWEQFGLEVSELIDASDKGRDRSSVWKREGERRKGGTAHRRDLDSSGRTHRSRGNRLHGPRRGPRRGRPEGVGDGAGERGVGTREHSPSTGAASMPISRWWTIRFDSSGHLHSPDSRASSTRCRSSCASAAPGRRPPPASRPTRSRRSGSTGRAGSSSITPEALVLLRERLRVRDQLDEVQRLMCHWPMASRTWTTAPG